MRLKCPNCEAQYEVSDSVIPLHGRDVQCSNCGQTWFQSHPQAEPEAALADDEDDAEFGGDDSLPNVAAGAWDSVDIDEAAAEPAAATAGQEPEDAAKAVISAAPGPAPDEPDSNDAAQPPDHGPDALPAFVSDELLPDQPDAAEDDAPSETGVAVAGAVAAMATEPKRRSLDEAVLSVLREEAERESKARRAAGGVETQTDMNLTAAEPVARGNGGLDSLPKLRVQPQAEGHVADLSTGSPRRAVEDLSAPVEAEPVEAEPVEAEPAGAEPAGTPSTQRPSRRDLLPDIEAFSSSLQANGGKSAAASAAAAAGYQVAQRPARRSGFRTGFLLIVLLAVLVFGLYAAAPALGSRFPAAVPMLNQFTATVDKGRVMVDRLMQSLLDRLNGEAKPAE